MYADPAAKRTAARPSYRPAPIFQYDTPTTFKDATQMGIEDAKLALKQTAQGALSMVTGPWGADWEKKRQNTAAERAALNTARDQYYGGDGAGGFFKEAGVRLPGNLIQTAPELLNPSNKLKAVNALYHGGRAYLKTKDPVKAVATATANVIGEKAESIVGNLPGNAVGAVLEKLGGKAIEAGAGHMAESSSNFIASTMQPKLKAK